MKLENKIIDVLKKLDYDLYSELLIIEYKKNKLYINCCTDYNKPSSKNKINLYKLIEKYILKNYKFNKKFKSSLIISIDIIKKEIKLEFIYPYVFYRKVDEILKLS